MSRTGNSSARSLEELEKLEQQITLTLQEIDQNFNRAHRIVSTSILPIIEQYRDHSNSLWEASKFWKQFFEASANITLCGVEENEQEEELSYTQSHDNTSAYGASQQDETFRSQAEEHESYDQGDDTMLDDADMTGSTPRAPRSRSAGSGKPKFADYPSSYETLKQELKAGNEPEEDETEILPSTPGAKQRIPDMSMTPTSSPFDPTSYEPTSFLPSRTPADPLMHRVLDKNYRLQATPHTARKERRTPVNKPSWRDSDSPMSSPPAAAPQLHTDIFSSPIRQQYSRPTVPRTPGVSVQTPATAKFKDALQSRDLNQYTRNDTLPKPKKDEITWESDSDEDADDVYAQLGMSPPKTIQFSLPQTRLLQTPAREASKRIVEDLLTTAGAGFDDSDVEDSPSMVGMKDELDDSF
ncbi:DASH complex subunit Ask1 [Phlyctema vagabunda]|uniref:DASH complex subunit ASK1 n=1 Tax=Phlyctema vagabunda TaxID=108571 RepID=A0ABR4P505_9HELO